MDFRDQFRKMSGDVGKMAREVADTSKKATARARIRRMINTCNDSLQTIYQEIGTRYYTENQCDPQEQYAGLFQQAADTIAQIDVLKSELAGLDHAVICPSCGSKVMETQRFCPNCGCRTGRTGCTQCRAEIRRRDCITGRDSRTVRRGGDCCTRKRKYRSINFERRRRAHTDSVRFSSKCLLSE